MSTTEKIATLTATVAKLATDLPAAEARVRALQNDYNLRAVERLAQGNAKSARAARQGIADAQDVVDDLRLALVRTQDYLAAAKAEQAAEAEEAAWKRVEAAAKDYIEGIAELQDALDLFVERFLATQPLADQMLRLAPSKSVDIQRALVEHQRSFDVQLRIFAKGGSRLGRIGKPTIMPPDLLNKQCDLVGMARAIVKELLSHPPRDPSKTKTTGDAA